MATLNKVEISRDWSNTGKDLVQFTINEIKGYYWKRDFNVDMGISEENARKLCEECVRNITDKEVEDYKQFLKMGEEYGWD